MSSKPINNFCTSCRKFQRCPTSRCTNNHRMCSNCAPSTTCPICKDELIPYSEVKPPSAIASSKTKCEYAIRGCRYLLEGPDVALHPSECRFRDFNCEGDSFGCWPCDWTGRYDQIPGHFEEEHYDSTLMLFKTEALMHLDLSEDFRNISLINYREGQNFFWYKVKVDQQRKKFYSAVQMISTRQLAERYFYEFEIFHGPIRKLKVTQICDSDATDIESIFENENCVAISFETLKNFIDENGDLMFRFRIMSFKKT